jgi:hypothetical protein
MYNEIIAAYNAGRNIIGEYQNKVILLPFIGIGESSVQFGLEVNQQSFLLTLISDGTLDTNNNNFTIPTKTSDLTNDSGFLTGETDPTVHILTLQKNENEELTTGEDDSISDYVSNNELVIIYYNGYPYFYDKNSERGYYFDGINGNHLRYYYFVNDNK